MTHKEISIEFHGDAQQVAVIRMLRPAKRNALNDGLILGLRDAFEALPATVSAAPQLAVSDWLAWFEGKGMQHPDSEFQLNTAQNRK